MYRCIFVYVILGIIGANCQFCDYYWRDYSGKIPQDALAAGQNLHGGDTYIAQVYVHGHGLFIGQIYPPSLEVELGCYGYKKKDYIIKILCTSEPESFSWLTTSHSSFHIDTIGKHAVVGGYDHVGNRGIIHIGRAMHQGVLKIGFVASYKIEDVIFYFAHNRRAEKAKTFEVLICQPNPFKNGIIQPRIVCNGTNARMSVPSNREQHYRSLKDRYTNCTHVDGNLELSWLQDEHLDLSFLQHIREVTGYVLISHVNIKRVVLLHLQIIKGRTLFKMNVYNEKFALLVTLSKMYTLELPSLRDVLKGSVGFFNNYNLCHTKTIDWNKIITDSVGRYVFVYNFTVPERDCTPCHQSCKKGCWGDGAENCQKFLNENCSPGCSEDRCFGSKSSDCLG